MKFPFEKEAMRGDPMPDGLSLADQMAYQTLASLYLRYHLGGITREQGTEEKSLLSHAYNEAVNERGRGTNLSKYHADLSQRIERFANAYAKNRTLENADRLYKALYGMEPTKKEEV